MTVQLIIAHLIAFNLQEITNKNDNKLHELNVGFLPFFHRGFHIISDVQYEISNALVFHKGFFVLLQCFI